MLPHCQASLEYVLHFPQKYSLISSPRLFFWGLLLSLSVLCMKFYSLGLGVMRRRGGGDSVAGARVGRGVRELARRPQSRHVAALSLLISTPRLENELLGCETRWSLLLLSPEVMHNCNNICQPPSQKLSISPSPSSTPILLPPHAVFGALFGPS